MTTLNDNITNEYGIDKFSGSFDKEELGVTIVLNASINEIRNPEALGLYVYLLARPSGWKINVKQLGEHFLCGTVKMYRMLNYLLDQKFISKTIIRDKGRFIKHHYRVHLSRFCPHIDNPIVVKEHAYKEKNIESKERDLNPIVENQVEVKKVKTYKEDLLFMEFYKNYPNKQKPMTAYKAFLKHQPTATFVAMLITDVLGRIEGNWKGRDKSKIPFPATYLNSMEWEGEIYQTKDYHFASRIKPKYKTLKEINRNVDLNDVDFV